MILRLYIYEQKVIVPTVVETEDGLFVDVAPVNVFDIARPDRWKPFIIKTLMDGNTRVPTPEPAESGGSAILEKLKIDKWTKFERKAVMYTVHTGSSYVKVFRTGKGADGMWGAKETDERQFHPRVPEQFLVDAIAADMVKQPEAAPPKPMLLLAPPPP